MRLYCLFVFCLSCGAAIASAQSAPEPLPRVSLRVLSAEGMVTDLAVSSPTGARTRVVARPTAFGAPFVARVTGGEVLFFRHGTVPARATEQGAPAPPEPVLARFPVQPEVDRYLVIVAAGGAPEARVFSVFAIPDGGESLPLRHARVLNFTGAPLAVRLGAGAAVVGAAQSVVLDAAPEADGHAALQLAISEQGDDNRWRLVRSMRVAVPGNRRLLALITPARPGPQVGGGPQVMESGVLDVRIIQDAAATP